MPPRKTPPPQLRHLPKVWLEALQEQCGGDWRRVYLDADGVPIVGNMAREELPPQGPTARKIRQHRAPKKTAEPEHPTPMVLANAKRPPQPRGLKPAVTAAQPSPPPQPERTLPSLDEAREVMRQPRKAAAPAPPVPPLPPLPQPEPEDETPCNICGLVGAHRRTCYNGLVAISGQPAPPPPTPPAVPVVAFEPPPPPVDESQLALDLDAAADEQEDDQPEDVAPELPAPEPVVTRRVITTPTPIFQPPPAITVNGRDIEDLPLREPEEPPRRRFDRPVVTDDAGKQWVLLEGINGESDWEGLDVIGTAHQVWLKLREGIPPEAPMYWYDDVTALHGVDLDMVESVARKPTRVEIAPETGVKKFPVLRFWRGDVCTVVGFREPNMPKIIAAYVSASAYNEYLVRSGRQVTTGGGGARRSIGVPRRPRTLQKRLTEMGAEIKEDTDEKTGTTTATVTYKGEEIGKYRIHPCTPSQIENDWQRLQRKISTLWQRELAGKVGI